MLELNLQALKSRYRTPLQAQAMQAKRFQSLEEFKPYGSPYFMQDQNPMKWFKSGENASLIDPHLSFTNEKAMVVLLFWTKHPHALRS